MGSALTKKKKKQDNADDSNKNDQGYKQYDDDAQGAARYALNVNNDDYTTTIKLMISCTNIPKVDIASESDPMVVAYTIEEGKESKVGQTEILKDNASPKFLTPISVQYNFEATQKLKFVIYDVDELKEKDNLDKHTFIGEVTISLHEIVCSPDQTIKADIKTKKKKKNGKTPELIVKAVEEDTDSSKIQFNIGVKQFVSKTELCLQISVPTGHQQQYSVLKLCEFKQNNKNGFFWQPFTILSSKIPDEKGLIKFEVFEKAKTGPKQLVGETEVTLNQILDQPAKSLKITNKGLQQGELKINECKKVIRHTFLNYVYAGADISLIIALDFTNSNKDPSNPKSLHTQIEDKNNQYLQALDTIGNILRHYDTDQKIPLYGFGAKLPPQFNVVSHCFALNKNFFDPEINGLEEVLDTYREIVRDLKFHGPTVFSEIINMATDYAKSSSESEPNYYILLIITDGAISDLEATKKAIVNASSYPISIVIVGVGDEKFDTMDELDSDAELLYSKALDKKAERDIVQFVPFEDYKDDIEELAKKTLEEVPKQVIKAFESEKKIWQKIKVIIRTAALKFLEYMTSHNIEPPESSQNTRMKADIRDRRRAKVVEKEMPQFLIDKKNAFIEKLRELDFDYEEIMKMGVATPDINLVIEMVSERKNRQKLRMDLANKLTNMEDQFVFKPKKNLIKFNTLKIAQDLEVETVKSKKKEENYRFAQKVLETKDSSSLNKKIKTVGPQYVTDFDRMNMKLERNQVKEWHFEQKDQNEHFRQLTANQTPISNEDDICLICYKNKINTIFQKCGHACICHKCAGDIVYDTCLICKQTITSLIYTQKIQ